MVAKIDIIRYELGSTGLFFIILDDDFIIKLYEPCPPILSNHA